MSEEKINKYNKSKVYKITCNTTGLIYIGSTTEPTLARRLAQHVNDYKKHKNGKFNFITSFKVLEHNDYEITLLESVNCSNRDELRAHEKHHIQSNVCVNKYVPNRTKKEYDRQYRADNKEKINKQNDCVCGGKYTTQNKSIHLKTSKHQTYIKQQQQVNN